MHLICVQSRSYHHSLKKMFWGKPVSLRQHKPAGTPSYNGFSCLINLEHVI